MANPAPAHAGRVLDSGMRQDMSVLEPGCDGGAYTPYVARALYADDYHLPFADGSFDLACLVSVLPEMPDQDCALSELQRVLRAGGILAVTEFLPDPDYPLMSTTIRWGTGAGSRLQGTLGNLWSYTVRFIKPLGVGPGAAGQ